MRRDKLTRVRHSSSGPGEAKADGAALVHVGDTAPDFTLRWTFDRSFTLSEALVSGPVLVVFYVFDFGRY